MCFCLKLSPRAIFPGGAFKELFEQYASRALVSGVHTLFLDIKPLFDNTAKRPVMMSVLHEIASSLKTRALHLPWEDESEEVWLSGEKG